MEPRSSPRLLLLVALLIASTSTWAFTISEKPQRLLVVLDDESIEKSHAGLLESLRKRNYELDVRSASSDDLSLMSDGEYAYTGVALLCPKASGMERKLPIKSLEAFVDAGHDVFMVATGGFSEYTRNTARLAGVDMGGSEELVVDHAHKDGWTRAGGHAPSARLFGRDGAKGNAGLFFKGPPATLFTDNELVDAVVWGAPSAYGASSPSAAARRPMRAVGAQLLLGAALSTRVRSRVVYWGSLDALADDVKAGDDHVNALRALAAWTFGYSGVLAVAKTRHWRTTDGASPDAYRVRDELAFEIDVLEWIGDMRRWRSFSADDVQLEFVMLNPWVRTRFTSLGNGTLRAVVRVPDQIGVYKFRVEHRRPGIEPIDLQHVVPVRPFLHNEYPRFIRQAIPYYTASFSMLVGVLLLGIVLLYGDDTEPAKRDSTSAASTNIGVGKVRKSKHS